MDHSAWQKLGSWMGKIDEAITAYDQADSEYGTICNRSQSSMLTTTTTANNENDANIALRWEVLEARRKVVEATCEGYVSLIHQSFEDCKSNVRIATDKSRFEEQRRIMFQDAEVRFADAIANHKIRSDRQKANDGNREMKDALDSSAKVVDAVENMKMTVSVDWWMFLQEMDQLIRNRTKINVETDQDGDSTDSFSDPPSNDDDKASAKYMDHFNAYLDNMDFEDDCADMIEHEEPVPLYNDYGSESMIVEEWSARVDIAGVDSMYNWYRMHNPTLSPDFGKSC